jgi:hypothetical protein
MLAQEPEADAERLFATEAELARAVAYARVHDNEFICSVDEPHGIGTHYPVRRDSHARQALEDEEIEVIESRSKYTNAHLSRTGRWDRDIVAKLEAIEAAVRGDRERSHQFSVMQFVVGYI